jgi:O-antigen/teichoic acid export membrane protein
MKISIGFLKNQFIKLWNKGAFHIFGGSFLSKFVAFFGSIFLVRALSKTSYGLLGYIENIYGYIYIFAGMGLGNALLRYVILGKTRREKFTYYRYAITRGTAFNVIFVLIVAVCSLFYPHPDEFQSAKWLLLIILLAMPFQFLMDSNALTYRAMLANKRYAITAFITSTALIISRYIGAVFFDLNGVGGLFFIEKRWCCDCKDYCKCSIWYKPMFYFISTIF